MSKLVSDIISSYKKFEECVAKILSEAGYSTLLNVVSEKNRGEIDIVAEKNGNKYCIEVKFTHISENTILQTLANANTNSMLPVLVTSQIIEEKKRKEYQNKYSDLILIDVSNLLYAVKNNDELRNELIATLPYTVEKIEPCEGPIDINILRHDDFSESLIKEMELCQEGHPMAREYEILCHKLLENIFSTDLALWKEQQKSNSELYRFDLLCRIKDGNQKTFWSILENYFNSKYVIFEFKNYNDKVTQKEIYTTEKYLYAKALRCVAIMIAANGYDDNARWAAKGCLRENGKLIILLETSDLIEMNRLKDKQDDPANYLLDKLDSLLLELEK